MEADGERNCSDSDDSSSVSWVILNEEGNISEAEDPLASVHDEPIPVPAADLAAGGADPGQTDPAEAPMDASGDSGDTVIERSDVSASVGASGAVQTGVGRAEEGSDIEVIPGDQHDDEYFEDDPMNLCPEDSGEESSGAVQLVGSLPSDTVLRRRPGRSGDGRDRALDQDRDQGQDQHQHQDRDRDQGWDQGRDRDQDQDQDQGQGRDRDSDRDRESDHGLDQEQTVEGDRVRNQEERDRWADDTDLSSLPDQMVLDVSNADRLRQYVHQRNNTVNHLLTVLLVLCVTCVLGLGVGHFLGWLHHHELTEEIVHTLDEKLDVLRDDLMTCMTTEDDQDLDSKWIKELLNENEALLHQLHHEDGDDTEAAHCSAAGYAHLRDQVNQLRMENDELKANIAKMRYGSVSQDGYVLRRHRDQINQLMTENGELARELRRTRYLQPPTDQTDQEEPAPSADHQSSPDTTDSSADSSADSSQSDSSDSDSTDSDSSPDEGLLSALLGWRPAPDSAPLQEARRRLWTLWQEASDFSRAEPANKYVKMAGRSLAKVEKTLMKAFEKVQEFGQEMLEDDGEGGGGVEKAAGKLGRKVDKVVAKLDERWQEIRSNWEGKLAAREAEEQPVVAPAVAPAVPPASLLLNDTDPSVAAFYARRSRLRQLAREEDDENWQHVRAKSRAERRGAFHGASWLLERSRARQQLRQRRGEEPELPQSEQRWRQKRQRRGEEDETPRSDKRWRQERERSRGEWQTLDDDDDLDDEDDDDDDFEDHAARMARHMEANARFQERIQKTVQRHAAKINRKVRENHWKHFGGRNRHEFRQRFHKY